MFTFITLEIKLSKMILTDEPDMKVLIFCAAIVNSKREVHVVHTDVSRKRVHFIVNLRSVNSY